MHLLYLICTWVQACCQTLVQQLQEQSSPARSVLKPFGLTEEAMLVCMPYAACCIRALQALLACKSAPADSAVINVLQLQVEAGQLVSIITREHKIVGTMRALPVQAQH